MDRRGGGAVYPSARSITILSRFFVMLVFLFCKLFEHYSQFEPNSFPYHKDKAFPGNKI